jgi:hypothetical protein
MQVLYINIIMLCKKVITSIVVTFTHLCREVSPQNPPETSQLQNLRKELSLVLNLS